MIDIDRLRKAFKDIFEHNEADRWIYGLVGKSTPSGVIFEVPGRPNFIFVTIRNAGGGQTAPAARNDAGIPHSAGLPVRMRYEGKTLVIDGVVYRDDLATTDPPPPTGGWIHIHDDRYYRENEHINVSAGAADAGKPIVLDAGGKLDASLLDSEDIADVTGAMVTGNTETGITVTYDDADNTLDFVVDTEFIADTVGAMVTGNTETDIAVTYDDADNTLDFVVSPTLVGDRIHAATDKATPVDADELGIADSAASWVLKKLTWANVKATLTTLFDAIYIIAGGKAGGQSIHGDTAANGDLTVRGTIHPTKTSSYILMQPDGGFVGIGPVAAPTARLWVEEDTVDTGAFFLAVNATDTAIPRGSNYLNRDQSANSFHGFRMDFTHNSGGSTRGMAFGVGKEQLFTSTPGTQDAYVVLMVAQNGVLVERLRISSAGILSITQIIRALGNLGLQFEDDAGNFMAKGFDGGGFTRFSLSGRGDVLYETFAIAALKVQLAMTRAATTTVVNGFWATVNMGGRIGSSTHAGTCRFFVQGKISATIQFANGPANLNITVTTVTQTSTDLTLKFAVTTASGSWDEFCCSIVADSPVDGDWTITGSQVA